MTKVLSVRINKKLEDIIEKFTSEEQEEQSDVIRDLITSGSIFKAMMSYIKGTYSIGKAAYLAGITISEFMDLLSELGIKSNIGIDDILESNENLAKYL